MLFLVPTPIGNLADITLRALEVLKEADLILCEDTRHSLKLLKHYEIERPLLSYHQFNEAEREEKIVAELKAGKKIALISDAGTPGICDPGARLVGRCHQEGLEVTSLPGPCAVITGLTLAGAHEERFQFVGFLPRKAGELRRLLAEALTYRGTTICYESPQRIEATLKLLGEMAPTRQLALARELTKRYEECQTGTASELLESSTPRGEIVLMIRGNPTPEEEWHALTAAELVAYLTEEYQLQRPEALKLAATMKGVPKRTIYNELERDRVDTEDSTT